MKGFFNRILIIDVTRQTTRVTSLSDDTLKQYLGGKGLATHLLLQYNPPGVDPLSPDNHLIVGLGPLTDSLIVRLLPVRIFFKSPLTGFMRKAIPEAGPLLPSAGPDMMLS